MWRYELHAGHGCVSADDGSSAPAPAALNRRAASSTITAREVFLLNGGGGSGRRRRHTFQAMMEEPTRAPPAMSLNEDETACGVLVTGVPGGPPVPDGGAVV